MRRFPGRLLVRESIVREERQHLALLVLVCPEASRGTQPGAGPEAESQPHRLP